MSERQSSGLVKKGKFVRRLLEILNEGLVLSVEGIMTEGKGEIGPSQLYVQENLDKLVASGEVTLENGEYSVPNAKPRVAPVQEQEAPQTPVVTVQERKIEPFAKPPMMNGDRLARNEAFESFLCCSFLNETPGWEAAADYYCATHGAKWSIFDFGKNWGDRLKFE